MPELAVFRPVLMRLCLALLAYYAATLHHATGSHDKKDLHNNDCVMALPSLLFPVFRSRGLISSLLISTHICVSVYVYRY